MIGIITDMVGLLKGTPKFRYKFNQHVKRWEKRYNKDYPKSEAQMGRWDGIPIIKEKQ